MWGLTCGDSLRPGWRACIKAWCLRWSGARGGELVDLRGRVDGEPGEDVLLGLADLGALAEGAGGAGERADVDAAELAAQFRPGGSARVLGDAGQEEGEPAEDDVGADAFFLAVVDRAQVDDLLHVAPAALDFQELLIAQRDVLGGHLGIGGPEQAAGGDPQVPVQAGLGGDDAAELGALVPAEVVRIADQLGELGDHPGADGGVALGSLRVVADDEPLVLGDADFLDLEVARDVLVASLPGQGGFRLGGAGAELLPDDVVVPALAQVAAVFRGGEAAVGDPYDAGQGPVPHVVLDLPDQGGVAGVPGPAPYADRDAVPGDGHPDDDLGQVVAVVLGLAEGAEPGSPALIRILAAGGVAVPV